MKEIQAEYWFSAHLHVKFAAVYEHASAGSAGLARSDVRQGSRTEGPAANPDEIAIEDDFDNEAVQGPPATVENPDEIAIDDDDFDEEPVASASGTSTTAATGTGNPDEIAIGDDFDDGEEQIVYQPRPVEDQTDGLESEQVSSSEVEEALKVDESADLVEEARKDGLSEAAEGIIGSTSSGPSTIIEPQPQVRVLDPTICESSSHKGRWHVFLVRGRDEVPCPG